MEVEVVRDDGFACNVYRLGDSLVDAGDDPRRLPPAEEVEGVYLTHTHPDHTDALVEYEVPVYLHQDEKNPSTVQKVAGEVRTVGEGDTVKMGDTDFEVLHTPGHSRGSVSYWCPEEGVLFSGDVVFDNGAPGSVGDDSEPEELRTSLRRLASLEPPPGRVYPGHREPFDDIEQKVRIALNLV